MQVTRYHYFDHFSQLELDSLLQEIKSALVEGRYILSDEVSAFEQEFAAYVGTDYAVGCNSGTDALIMALRALDIGHRDEVILPANTFYASALAVSAVGAIPVLVDVDPNTFLMTAATIEPALSSRTRAIMAVHLYGNVCNMDEIAALCTSLGLAVIEDCAQAHGASYRGRRAGTFSSIGCFSFHPSKNLPAAGDAGICVTRNPELEQKLRMLRNLGQVEQGDHRLLGYNSKLDTLQAIVLRARLPKLDQWNGSRRSGAAHYQRLLSGQPLRFQHVENAVEPVFHMLQAVAPQRDSLLKDLNRSGIEAVVRYPVPVHLQSAFAYLGYRPGQFPVSELLSRSLLSLPLHHATSTTDIEYVRDCIIHFYERVHSADGVLT